MKTNQSVEFMKKLKSRNSGKKEESETKLYRLTNYHNINKDVLNNQTFHNTSNDNEILLTEFMNNRVKTSKATHKKNTNNNLMKAIKFSSSKKGINTKEVISHNKSINYNNNFLKNTKCVLKNNKSNNSFIRKVEARSNNISPIDSSFTNKQIKTKKDQILNHFTKKNEVLETENNGNDFI